MKRFEDLFNDLFILYKKNPFGWRISIKKEPRFGNIFITNSRNVWQIKLDSIYKASPIGLGSNIGDYSENKNLFDIKTPYYGLRSIKNEDVRNMLMNNDMAYAKRLIDEILNRPVVDNIDEMRGNNENYGFLSGPIHFSQEPDKSFLSKNQKKLDKELNDSLDKLLFRKGYDIEYL